MRPAIFRPALHSVLAQTRAPDELLVINNASTDATRAVALQIPGVHVIDEPRKGLVRARETGRRHARGELLVYLDADCRAPLTWLARVEQRFIADPRLLALSAPYRFSGITGRSSLASLTCGKRPTVTICFR
jgi:glycosyltransferase involved in cell wall biosynthesis